MTNKTQGQSCKFSSGDARIVIDQGFLPSQALLGMALLGMGLLGMG
jgi:hypothetical protein